jgi:hypothetical protein
MKYAFVRMISGIVDGFKRTSSMVLAILLCSLVFLLSGCYLLEQSGETTAKGHRRHQRNMTLNQQNLMTDIDRALLIDKPSKLTEKRIPPTIGGD